jgi:hypothetical protein
MISQIFKESVPNIKLFSLLELIAIKSDKKYIFNKNSYKKGLIDDKLQQFINECKPYYYASKQKYLDRKLSYSSVTTVLRQICNFNKIVYTSQIKYYKSDYDIEYHIYGSNDVLNHFV